MIRALLPTALAALTLLSAPAVAQAPALRIEPYAFRLANGSDLPAERGTFSVPEDRRDRHSRRIEIGFVRFRSTNPHPGAPIVYLAGGPGGSGVGTARGPRQPLFLALRQVADVILLDQRGTGLSNQLPPCRAERSLDPAAGLNEASLTAYYREAVVHCVARWRAAGVAVNGYNTDQSAADLDDLRRALGVPRIDLWAISYGTHLAMATMRRFPNAVGRVALASAEGMDQTVKRPADIDAAFARIDAVRGGGLTERMRRVHARFDAQPQQVRFTAPDGGTINFRTDAFVLRMIAGFLAKNPSGHAQLAQFYAALDAGQTAPLGPIVWSEFYREPVAVGMGELMDIASGITDSGLAQAQRQVPGSIAGTAFNFPMPQLRGLVPGLDLGDGFRREIRSDHPVLLFEGDLDVRTPLEEQAASTAGLRNLHRIRVRGGGHDLYEAHPEVPAILTAFFSGRPVTTRELVLPMK